MKVGDKIEVKLLEITPDGKFRLSRKALIPRPEGMPEEEDDYKRRDSSSRGRRPDGNRRDDRRGDDRRGPRRRY
jgi:polyribonucleotide nucleotidyltransferase